MKQRNLLSLSFLLLSTLFFGQSVKITSIIEGDCPTIGTTNGSQVQIIELYVDGTVDVSNLQIEFQFSWADWWVAPSAIGDGEYTDTFLYLTNDFDAFDREFPGVRTTTNTGQASILTSVDGGDKIRLVDTGNSNEVIDIYGVDGTNGQSEDWNFINSYAQRKVGSGPNATFDTSEWDIQTKNSLLFTGECWSENKLNTIIELGKDQTLSANDFEFSDENIKIFPNPAANHITLSGITSEVSYEIFDANGRTISSGILSNEVPININTLTNGIYYLKTETGIIKKIIKK